jgi:hypothetical protein
MKGNCVDLLCVQLMHAETLKQFRQQAVDGSDANAKSMLEQCVLSR